MFQNKLLKIRKLILDGRKLLSTELKTFRTLENNPANHDNSHLGRFYSIELKTFNKLFRPNGVNPEFFENSETFGESSILIRKPFLDIKKCIESYDLSYPTMRYILHGDPGQGKTMTLAHLAHYGHAQDFILVHVPWLPLWTRFRKEYVPSANRQGYIDHTENSVLWLAYFRNQNYELLNKLELKTEKEYNWTQRESTPAGSNLMDIVQHGITRPPHSTECIYALISEIKSRSTKGLCKTMVLVDGVNGLYRPSHKITYDDQTEVPVEKMTLFEAVKLCFKSDWSGGVVIGAVDKLAVKSDLRETNLPRYLLTKSGWEDFDPFVPVEIPKYTSQEIQTTIDYFLDIKWLMHPNASQDNARIELEILSTRNPLTLMKLCNTR